jgi:cell division protein FtsQ
MRPLKQRPLGEGLQRRQELRRQRRLERLAEIWRLLALIAAATGLGWVLLRHGWMLQSPAQVTVQGTVGLGRDQVIRAGDLRFPQPLLDLDPADLRRRLAAQLPVDQVVVQRHMLPAGLTIRLHPRVAVARAQRRTSAGLENGFVDRTGRWISARQQAMGGAAVTSPLWITGWQERYQPGLEVLLQQLPASAAVTQLRFRPEGDLWLVSSRLGLVRFGTLDDRLQRRLQVLDHLAADLPKTPAMHGSRAIDLDDPEHPELLLVSPLDGLKAVGGGRKGRSAN